MDNNFWRSKWEKGEIAFHRSDANPLLAAHFEKLQLPNGSRVFLPLCGKTVDLAWLLQRGCRVAGAELSELAINELFADLGIEPEIRRVDTLLHYSAANIDLWVGDIFDLSADKLGAVDAIYDRAALVALPEAMRGRYAAHLTAITRIAPQLLISYQYDQRLADGPPFSVSEQEIGKNYAADYHIDLIEKIPVEGGLRGKVAATEAVWLLQRQDRQ